MKILENRQVIAGYCFALGATALWSGNFIIARGLNESIPPVSLAFWRWVVAVLVFLPFAWKPLLSERKILRKNLGYLAITSLLGITTFNTLIYFAGHTTSAINLSLISITFPVFIIVLSRIFLKETITKNKGIGVLLVIIGVVLLITQGDISRLLQITFAIGDLWMLAAAIIFAIYSMLIKRKPEQLSIWAFQLSTFLLGLLFLFPFFLWERVTSDPVNFDMTTIISILYVGICASLAAFILWNKAILAIGASKSAMVYYTLPLFSGALAYLILGEALSSIHVYSAILIVAGILFANYETRGQK